MAVRTVVCRSCHCHDKPCAFTCAFTQASHDPQKLPEVPAFRLAFGADSVDETLSASQAPIAAYELSRPNSSPFVFFRPKPRERVAVHVRLNVSVTGAQQRETMLALLLSF